MQKQLIVIAGNIATGKTTLANALASRMHYRCEGESVDDNPYLPDFYNDMRAWAFHLQIYFLFHRLQQHQSAIWSEESVILDRSVYEDREVFARTLHKIGQINDRDFQSYQRAFEAITRNLKPPSLIVYLTAPPPLLLSRIQRRGRLFETSITVDYISMLNDAYESWISTVRFCPVLPILVNELHDFTNTMVISKIVRKIEETTLPLAPVI